MTSHECSLSELIQRASVNRGMNLYPFTYFYRTRSQENGTEGADGFQRLRKYPVQVKTTVIVVSSLLNKNLQNP